MTKLLILTIFSIFIALVDIAHPTGFCYDKKCWSTTTNSYFNCDLQYNHCLYDSCADGSSFDSETVWCGFDEECDHVTYSGKAFCRSTDNTNFLELYYIYIVIGVGSTLLLICVSGACCCFFMGTCCFKSRSRGGRVLAQPAQQPETGYQMQVPQSPQPQYTGEAFLYQSNYPSQPGGYPPQHGGYPDQAGSYPPSASDTGYPDPPPPYQAAGDSNAYKQ